MFEELLNCFPQKDISSEPSPSQQNNDPMRHYVPVDQAKEEEKKEEEESVDSGGGLFNDTQLHDAVEADLIAPDDHPYMDIETTGMEEMVVSISDPGDFLFKEFVPPPDFPILFNNEMTSPASDLPPLHNGEATLNHAEPEVGCPKTEDEIEFLVNSVQYSRIMSEIPDENKLRDVVKSMNKLKVKDGDVVIQQGDTDNVQAYYVLESGAVDVFVFDQFRVTIQVEQSAHNCNSNKKEIVEPGWCFGELSFVFGAPRSASCIASADSVLWVLNRGPFDRILSGLSPLESLKIVRQESDPGDEFDADDVALTELALQNMYGSEFFEDKATVRDISANFMNQIASQGYVGLPTQVEEVMNHFNKRGGRNLKYDVKTQKIVAT